jgi:hypothetical protein
MGAAVHQLATACDFDREFIVPSVEAQLPAVTGHLGTIEQNPGSHNRFNLWLVVSGE